MGHGGVQGRLGGVGPCGIFTPAGDNTPPKDSILLGRGGDSYLIEVFCEDIAAIRPDAGQAPGPGRPAFS